MMMINDKNFNDDDDDREKKKKQKYRRVIQASVQNTHISNAQTNTECINQKRNKNKNSGNSKIQKEF